MYRPSNRCKLCDSKFESEFKVGANRRQLKSIPCKFLPCLHNLICLDCAKQENQPGVRFKECQFCGEKIKRVTYRRPVYDGYMQPDWEYPGAINYDGVFMENQGFEYWVSRDTVERWSNEVLYENTI